MTKEERIIEEFLKEIANFSREELEAKKAELDAKMTQMILDSDLIIKISVLDKMLKGN